MLGIVPAAGAGSRIQPLAFSKELLPVGTRVDGGVEHPRAIAEYLVERLVGAGADRLCFVISPAKSDIMAYFGGRVGGVPIAYLVQESPAGLCDALFRALPFVAPDEAVLVGLPDTVWFPEDALGQLPDGAFSFLLFPVAEPGLFDAVVLDGAGRVVHVEVKSPHPTSTWIWGAFKLPASMFGALHRMWLDRGRHDHYVGTLVNRYIAEGGEVFGVCSGTSYVDVGTLHGYREALGLLQKTPRLGPALLGQAPPDRLNHDGAR
jgi:dTDP-glucose pyrophosphorylase